MTLRGCTCSRANRRWQSSGLCTNCGVAPFEAQLTPVCLAILTGGTGLALFRNSAGLDTHWPDGRKRDVPVHYGLAKGSADFVGLYAPTGRFVAIEFKRRDGRHLDDQKTWQALVERLGGFYALVRCEDDARQVLVSLRGG